MLYVPNGTETYGSQLASWGTTRPNGANGTSVTPGAGSYGSYANVISSATSFDTYGILINFNSNTASTTSVNTVATIGVDTAGGTSYTDTITDLICGGALPYSGTGAGKWYFFPLFIPAGSTVGCKANGTVATAFRCGIQLLQQPVRPEMMRYGSFVESIGVSGNQGTAITPGTTSEGSWTSMGTTTKETWWVQFGFQVSSSDTAWVANAINVDVAVGDGTNFDIIWQDAACPTTTSETQTTPPLTGGMECRLPAGSTLYMRAQTSSSLDSYFASMYALGG